MAELMSVMDSEQWQKSTGNLGEGKILIVYKAKGKGIRNLAKDKALILCGAMAERH